MHQDDDILKITSKHLRIRHSKCCFFFWLIKQISCAMRKCLAPLTTIPSFDTMNHKTIDCFFSLFNYDVSHAQHMFDSSIDLKWLNDSLFYSFASSQATKTKYTKCISSKLLWPIIESLRTHQIKTTNIYRRAKEVKKKCTHPRLSLRPTWNWMSNE